MTQQRSVLSTRDFPVLRVMTTRWADNDMYGHLNNAVYYQLFDTAINGWIAEATGADARSIPAQGVVAESSCRYFTPVRFPERLTVGIRIERLGRSSVIYELGLFCGDIPACDRQEHDGAVAALGRWVHVYIDPLTGASVTIPEPVRSLLQMHAPTVPVGR
jgi:acyl-CoA thioester hydrolase